MPSDLKLNPRRAEFSAEVVSRLNALETALHGSDASDASARRQYVESEFSILTSNMDEFEAEEALSILDSLIERARTDAEVERIGKAWRVQRNQRLEELHEQYDAVVWDAVWKTLRDDAGQLPFYKDEVARDLHAACWLKITEQLEKYRDTGKISGWIWTLCQNVVYDWKRREARRHTLAPTEQLREAVVSARRPTTSRWLTPSRTGIRLKRSALCPECGDLKQRNVVSSTKSALTLSCGHTRPRGLENKLINGLLS
jgi:hypothetical protein